MTLVEAVRKVEPNFANGMRYGIDGCPHDFPYLFADKPDCERTSCERCWKREFALPKSTQNPLESSDIKPPKDNVNHPLHYQGKYECIDEMLALFGIEAVKHFCMCNVYKYRFRAANKNGQEDLDKAEWYMDKLIELEKE